MTDAIEERPTSFGLEIQGGLLDNLGINMYANLGKCLVEFAANAYDSDSPDIDIVLDVAEISAAREAVRSAAIASAKRDGIKRPTFIEDPLPPGLTVTITDHGHGMSPADVRAKYLPINRNRRKDESGRETRPKTEAGKRYVMGRKGIGKLSGFGAASELVVRSKRAGQNFWTQITLDLVRLRNETNLSNVQIPAEYIPDADLSAMGTVLTMRSLKCDSMKFTLEELEDALAEAFWPIKDDEFRISINGTPITRTEPPTEFTWPEDLNDQGYVQDHVGDDETGEIPFKYVAKFRNKNLPASRRGARIYCNGRLAFGPSLLGLNTGTHNFMAHQYLEFLVEADELDRQNVDLISTDRGDIRRNNDLVEAFLSRLTKLMQEAIAAHGRFRDNRADLIIDSDPQAEHVRAILEALPRNQQSAGRKLVGVIVSRYGVESEEFRTISPLIVQSMNAGEVLVDLIKASTNPTNIAELASAIVELRSIERTDALKVYRARRNGIHGLRQLVNKGEDEGRAGKRFEGALHDLLKKAPWLIKPELAGYLSSDVSMSNMLSKLAKELEIDGFAVAPDGGASDRVKSAHDSKRPDLVFLLGNTTHADRVLVVELKTPNLPMEAEHLSQLKRYIRKVEEWHQSQFAGARRPLVVDGILIGMMPDLDTKADGSRDLLDEINKRAMTDQWEVVGLNNLLERTEMVHKELIAALEVEDGIEAEVIPISGTPAAANA